MHDGELRPHLHAADVLLLLGLLAVEVTVALLGAELGGAAAGLFAGLTVVLVAIGAFVIRGRHR
jgi:hypothetical protein